ncbi:MAG: flavodoxin family protein [Treponema sp.]|jgi:multimeric flavodoxin WrbA|nr:flavodoxin family protein [Treponema sp.]
MGSQREFKESAAEASGLCGEGKKALVLMGSPRHEGATAKLVQCFIEQWKASVNPRDGVVVIEAYKAAVKPCIHCGYCKQTPDCRYDDDFKIIDRALKEADFLVIASPVYGLGFPAPLKAILDRTQQYFEAKFSLGIHKPIEKHKPALFLAAFGSSDPRGVKMMQDALKLTCLLMNAGLEHTIVAAHTDRVPVNLETVRGMMKQVLRGI